MLKTLLNTFVEFCGHPFVAVMEVEIDGREHGEFEGWIEPGKVGEYGCIESKGADVEGDEVGVFHQREAPTAELCAKERWIIVAVFLMEFLPECLKMRACAFLSRRISLVKPLEEFTDEVMPPRQLFVELLLLIGSVKWCTVEEMKVNRAIVVRLAALSVVTDEACEGEDDPREESPLLLGTWDVLEMETDGDRDIDDEEPDVATGTVEDASELGFLAAHTCQLPIGTIEDVCPYKEEDTDEVEQKAVCGIGIVVKEESACYAENNRHHRDGVGMHSEMMEQTCPQVAERTIENDVKPFLGIT